MAEGTPIFRVPHSEPNLIGREKELEQLHHQLLDDETPINLTALQGTGGIGKTQLAAKYCWQRRIEGGPKPYYRAIVWLNLAGAHSIAGQLAGYASELQLGSGGDNEARAAALIGRLRGRNDALLVLDNLEREEQLEADLAGIPNTRPRDLGCRVLITSRRPDLPGCTPLPLDFLRAPLDLALLEREAGCSLSGGEGAADLLGLLGGLPLALILAGRYLRKKPDVAQFAAKLRQHGADVVLTAAGEATRTYHERAGRSFQAVLVELWDSLPAHEPHYAALLLFMACLPEGSFTPAHLGRFFIELPPPDPLGFRADPVEDAVGWLHEAQLIERNASGELRLHPLIHAFIARRLERSWRAAALRRSVWRFTNIAMLNSLDERSMRLLALILSGVGQTFFFALADFQILFTQVAGDLRSGGSPATQILFQADIGAAQEETARLGKYVRALEHRLKRAHKPFIRIRWSTRTDKGMTLRLPGPGLDAASACALLDDNGDRRTLIGYRSGIVALWTSLFEFALSNLGHAAEILHCAFVDQDHAITVDRNGHAVLSKVDSHGLTVINTVGLSKPETGQRFRPRQSLISIAPQRGLIVCSVSGETMFTRIRDGANPRPLLVVLLGSETVCLAADGSFLAVAEDKTLWTFALSYDGDTLNSDNILWSFTGDLPLIPLSVDDRYVVASDGCHTKLFETRSGRLMWEVNLDARFAKILPGELGILVASDGSLYIIESNGGEPRRIFDYGYEIIDFATSKDTREVLTISGDGMARLWSVDPQEPVTPQFDLGGQIGALRKARDGRVVAAFSQSGWVTLLDAETGQPLREPAKLDGDTLSFAIDNEAQTVAVVSRTRHLTLADLTSNTSRDTEIVVTADSGLAISRDGRTVVTADLYGSLNVVRSADGGIIRQQKVDGRLSSVHATPNVDLVLSGGDRGRLFVWDLNINELHEIKGTIDDFFISIAITEDGSVGLAGGNNGYVVLWGHADHKSTVLGRHSGTVPGCAVDGETGIGASVAHDGTAAVWHLATGREVLRVNLGTPLISACLIGTLLVVGDNRGRVRAFEVNLP